MCWLRRMDAPRHRQQHGLHAHRGGLPNAAPNRRASRQPPCQRPLCPPHLRALGRWLSPASLLSDSSRSPRPSSSSRPSSSPVPPAELAPNSPPPRPARGEAEASGAQQRGGGNSRKPSAASAATTRQHRPAPSNTQTLQTRPHAGPPTCGLGPPGLLALCILLPLLAAAWEPRLQLALRALAGQRCRRLVCAQPPQQHQRGAAHCPALQALLQRRLGPKGCQEGVVRFKGGAQQLLCRADEHDCGAGGGGGEGHVKKALWSGSQRD